MCIRDRAPAAASAATSAAAWSQAFRVRCCIGRSQNVTQTHTYTRQRVLCQAENIAKPCKNKQNGSTALVDETNNSTTSQQTTNRQFHNIFALGDPIYGPGAKPNNAIPKETALKGDLQRRPGTKLFLVPRGNDYFGPSRTIPPRPKNHGPFETARAVRKGDLQSSPGTHYMMSLGDPTCGPGAKRLGAIYRADLAPTQPQASSRPHDDLGRSDTWTWRQATIPICSTRKGDLQGRPGSWLQAIERVCVTVCLCVCVRRSRTIPPPSRKIHGSFKEARAVRKGNLKGRPGTHSATVVQPTTG